MPRALTGANRSGRPPPSSRGGAAVAEDPSTVIMAYLRMQPEGYGAAIYTFELQSLIASSSPQFLLLRCCEVLLFVA